MTTVARKICLLGDFGVGKTSLVARFIHQTFTERYLTTIGVKIDTRQIERKDGTQVKLVIWDLAGAATLNVAGRAYVQGAAGMLFVCDATRSETLASVLELRHQARKAVGARPALLLVNKSDLVGSIEIESAALMAASGLFDAVHRTSARTGENVAEAFLQLVELCG